MPKQFRTPPQSPVLNPIEDLWDFLERKIRKDCISSKLMLKEVMREEWRKISSAETSKHIESIPRRLAEVIKRKGVIKLKK